MYSSQQIPTYPRSKSYEDEDTVTTKRMTGSMTNLLPQQEFLFRNVGNNNAQQGPRFVRKLAPYVQRHAGQPMKLEFEINDAPNVQITWLKDGKRLQNSPHTRINSTFGVHTLIIPNLSPDDAGHYTVHIETPSGNLDTACDVVVEGVSFF